MAVSNKRVVIPCEVRTVWDVVTSLAHYEWRSDLDRIEILNEKQFVEYTKEGYATVFTVTLQEPYRRWEFDMENDNMTGHWTGVFRAKNGGTELDFTEEAVAKKIFMRPFVKIYLKKQQARYVEDLKKILL